MKNNTWILLMFASFCIVSTVTINVQQRGSNRADTATTDSTEVAFKETVFVRGKDTREQDFHKRIEDDSPDGGSSIVVDNHNSMDVQDPKLNREKFLRELKAQENEQSNKRGEEQQLKRDNHAEREKLTKKSDDFLHTLESEVVSEQTKKKAGQSKEKKGTVREAAWRIKKGEVLLKADKISFTGKYTYMFWLRPAEMVSGWANILHKGQADVNRNPAVWFYPSSYRLRVRSGTEQSPTLENGGNNGCDPESSLEANKWAHVAFTHQAGALKVFVDGREVCAAEVAAPVANTGDLYVSNPWNDPAIADIADLRILHHILSPEEIASVAQEKKGIS